MAELQINAVSIAQRLEDAPDGQPQFLGELVGFPELRTLGGRPDKLREALLDLLPAFLKKSPIAAPTHRVPSGMAEVGTVTLELTPGDASAAWREPAVLSLPYVCWHHGADSEVAYVPALGIHVIASDRETLEERLAQHCQDAARRRGAAKTLLGAAYLARGETAEIIAGPWNAWPRTPKEDYEARYGDPKPEGALEKIARRLEPAKMPEMFGRAELLAELREVVAGPRAQAALLVGPPGVGKTALVMELARAGGIDRPIFQTGGARLVAGQTGFGMWQKRVRELVEEAREQKAILYLGSLFELMETGTYEGNAEGIASFLRPYFVRGELIAILEATPEQVPAIEKRDPKLLDGLRRIPVAEPDPAEARQIIEAFARHRGERFTQAGIDRTIALHRRYASYSAFPGRPLRFMDRLLKDAAQADARLGEPAVNAAFSRETGLPMLLIDDATRLDPAEVRAWFGGRIAGQDAAADQMADMIAMIKAGLSRPEKPLASFFFAGPTGVGKTEMAKAIAEFFYGAKDRMIRFDMSEFGTPGSAARMAGGGAGGEGQLTAKVRAQPFGVILLDEIEKADAEVFDLLLQILGEGRLTDSAGRVADFTNAIIIMTSNLGARDFQRGAVGFRDPRESGAEAADHFSAAVKAQVRPELFNRIDQILPFLPLTRDAVAAIARREIALANARDGLCRRGIELRLSPGALRAVLDAGYDPAYGARPLKRALESLVLAPLAAELAKSPRDHCVAVAEMGEGSGAAAIRFQFLPRADGNESARMAEIADRLAAAAAARRRVGALARSPLAAALQSEQARLQMQKDAALRAASKRRGGGDPYDKAREERLADLGRCLGDLDARLAAAAEREEWLTVALGTKDAASAPSRGAPPASDFDALLLALFRMAERPPESIRLLIYADARAALARLAAGYLAVAEARGWPDPSLYLFPKTPPPILISDDEQHARGKRIAAGEALAALMPDQLNGIGAVGLEFPGAAAALELASEAGSQTFVTDSGAKTRCLVEIAPDPLAGLELPLATLRKPDFDAAPSRRVFDAPKNVCRDALLGKVAGAGIISAAALDQGIAKALVHRARRAAFGDRDEV